MSNKVLIVDDNPEITGLVKHLLKDKFEIWIAHNGLEALNLIEKELPDLVLMDLVMPVMDGITAIKEIRKKYDNAILPIVVFSAIDEKEKRLEALNEGSNDFITKPFDKSELIARISTNVKVSVLAKELVRKNNQLELEKELARKVQINLLPNHLKFKGIDIATFYKASDLLAGDFFDAWEKDDEVHIVLGDVSGHGTASALLMTACKAILNTLGLRNKNVIDTITESNRLIRKMVENSGMFLTLVYVCVNLKESRIDTVSAGHNSYYLFNGTKMHTISSSGLPLGLFDDSEWELEHYPFNKRDKIFIYSDGLTEVKNAKGEMLGTEKLEDLLNSMDLNPELTIQEIYQRASEYSRGNFDDDVTMLAVHRS